MTKNGISLKEIVGKRILDEIQDSYLRYLESSAAIYEVNGDYASALFTSKYCDFLNQASRRIGGKTDEKALKSGKWICHEDCWATSLKSMKDKSPCEIECSGGIRIFAAPIIAEGMVIGSNNAGVSNPPTDKKKIEEIARKYRVNPEELLAIAREYIPRPDYVFDAAKNHILTAARTIAEFFLRRQDQEELRQASEEWRETFDSITDLVFILDAEFNIIKANKSFCDAVKSKPDDITGKKCYEILHGRNKPWPGCPSEKSFIDRKPHSEEVDDEHIGKPLLITVSPILDAEGNIKGVVHIAKDISKIKATESELMKKMQDLERFNRIAVDRELRMKELKSELTDLRRKLGER